MILLRKVYRLNYGVEPRLPKLNWLLKPIVYRQPQYLKKFGLSFATNERLVENYFVLSSVPMAGEKKIIDVGCCHSILPFVLASAGHKVTGVDLYGVEWVNPNFSHLEMPLGKAMAVLPKGGFDFVLCISTFEHVGIAPPSDDEPRQFLMDLASLASPDGKVIITTPFAEETYLVEGFEKRYSKKDLLKLFQEAGLSVTMYLVSMNTHLFELQKIHGGRK